MGSSSRKRRQKKRDTSWEDDTSNTSASTAIYSAGFRRRAPSSSYSYDSTNGEHDTVGSYTTDTGTGASSTYGTSTMYGGDMSTTDYTESTNGTTNYTESSYNDTTTYQPSLASSYTDTTYDSYDKKEEKASRVAAHQLRNGESFDTAVDTVTTAISSLWQDIANESVTTSATPQTKMSIVSGETETIGTSTGGTTIAKMNVEPLGPAKVKEIQALTQNWAMISVAAAVAVLKEGGTEKSSQAAAAAVLKAGREGVRKDLDPTVTLNNAATDCKAAIVEKGGTKQMAAAAAVVIMDKGTKSISDIKKKYSKLTEKEERIRMKQKEENRRKRQKEKERLIQTKKKMMSAKADKKRATAKIKAIRNEIDKRQLLEQAAEEERLAKESALVNRMAVAEEEKARMVETIREIQKADVNRESEKVKMASMLQQMKGAMEKKIVHTDALEDQRMKQEEQMYMKLAETEAEKERMRDRMSDLENEEVNRQQKEMLLMDRMAAAEADRARLAEKMKHVKEVMDDRKRVTQREDDMRKKNEEELLQRMKALEVDKEKLNEQLKFMAQNESDRKQKEYELIQNMTNAQTEKERLHEQLKNLQQKIMSHEANEETAGVERKRAEMALMKRMAAAEAEKARFAEKMKQLQQADAERKRNETSLGEKIAVAERDKINLHSKMLQLQQAEAIFKRNEMEFLRKMNEAQEEIKRKQLELNQYSLHQKQSLQKDRDLERQRAIEMEKVLEMKNSLERERALLLQERQKQERYAMEMMSNNGKPQKGKNLFGSLMGKLRNGSSNGSSGYGMVDPSKYGITEASPPYPYTGQTNLATSEQGINNMLWPQPNNPIHANNLNYQNMNSNVPQNSNYLNNPQYPNFSQDISALSDIETEQYDMMESKNETEDALHSVGGRGGKSRKKKGVHNEYLDSSDKENTPVMWSDVTESTRHDRKKNKSKKGRGGDSMSSRSSRSSRSRTKKRTKGRSGSSVSSGSTSSRSRTSRRSESSRSRSSKRPNDKGTYGRRVDHLPTIESVDDETDTFGETRGENTFTSGSVTQRTDVETSTFQTGFDEEHRAETATLQTGTWTNTIDETTNYSGSYYDDMSHSYNSEKCKSHEHLDPRTILENSTFDGDGFELIYDHEGESPEQFFSDNESESQHTRDRRVFFSQDENESFSQASYSQASQTYDQETKSFYTNDEDYSHDERTGASTNYGECETVYTEDDKPEESVAPSTFTGTLSVPYTLASSAFTSAYPSTTQDASFISNPNTFVSSQLNNSNSSSSASKKKGIAKFFGISKRTSSMNSQQNISKNTGSTMAKVSLFGKKRVF